MRRTTLPAFTIACLLLAGATACGEGDGPNTPAQNSPSTPVASSVSPTNPVAPDRPAAALHHTPAGAKSFTKYFFDTANYAQATLDITALSALSDKNCGACASGSEGLRRMAKAGGEIVGGEIKLSKLSVEPSSVGHDTFMLVRFTYHIGELKEDYPGTVRDREYKPSSGTAYVVLRPTASGWLVNHWEMR